MTETEQQILTLLKQQQAQLDALLLLLRQELDVLVSRDYLALDTLTGEKTNLLSEIQSTDEQLATASGLPDCQQQVWFLDLVNLLDSRLEECKAQTAVNQQVLEQSQLTLDRLKNDILASRGKSGLTYTSKGKPAIENKGGGIKA